MAFRFAFSVGFLSLVFACSGETTSAGLTQADACKQFSAAICAKADECIKIAGLTIPKAECESTFASSCANSIFGANTGYSPDSVASCSNAVRGSSCDIFNKKAFPAECIIPGKVASGQKCTRDEDCASRSCAGATANACGTCATKKIAEGELCSVDAYGRDDCDNGLTCHKSKCAKFASEGASCTDAPCQIDLVCSQGTCSKGAALGEACDDGGVTAPHCNSRAGLFCGFVSKKCEQASVVKLGETCGVVGAAPNRTYAACNLDGFCSGFKPPSALVGVCAARRGYQEACTESNECAFGLDCRNGVCGQKPLSACPQ